MKRVPVADDVEQRPTTIGGVDAVEVTIHDADSSNVVLYFHGGVYVIGSRQPSILVRNSKAKRCQANDIDAAVEIEDDVR